jgi:hypothetical protein
MHHVKRERNGYKVFHKTEKLTTLSKIGDFKELKKIAGPLIRQQNIKNRANVCAATVYAEMLLKSIPGCSTNRWRFS